MTSISFWDGTELEYLSKTKHEIPILRPSPRMAGLKYQYIMHWWYSSGNIMLTIVQTFRNFKNCIKAVQVGCCCWKSNQGDCVWVVVPYHWATWQLDNNQTSQSSACTAHVVYVWVVQVKFKLYVTWPKFYKNEIYSNGKTLRLLKLLFFIYECACT